MKNGIGERTNHKLFAATILPAALLSVGLMVQSPAAHAEIEELDEIIVTARRQEENVQDIPISVTVLDQYTLSNSNVFSSADLKQFTPSLAINQRFGPDQASFAIRGFTQELRTTASVGFYFAEVVAPRGGGSVTSGDGAGPGAFFDLQNVLVLKGPQGTLFGRNTTGGAILLTPQEPTHELEGYLEGSAGDYGMRRLQGVINVPMDDRVRTRFGVDTMQRDGHLDNKSGIGPSELGDVDYVAARASMVVEVTDSVQNYTILSYTNSENNGVVSSLIACKPGGILLGVFFAGTPCTDQLARQGDDFYALEQGMQDPVSKLKQWQAINTTTWDINDDLSVKNLLSYADLEQTTRTSIYGVNYVWPYAAPGDPQTYGFVRSDAPPGYPTNSQTSFVEELQFQGYAFDGDLTWQAGLYYENSRPDGKSATFSVNNLYCSNVDTGNPDASNCVDPVFINIGQTLGFVPSQVFERFPHGFGSIADQTGEIEYTNMAAYGEGTYDISAQWRVTVGLRYTKDKVEGADTSRGWAEFPYELVADNPPAPGVAGFTDCVYTDTNDSATCESKLEQTSEAVTGLIDFDYFVTSDVMLYAKYSRGYRMGSVNIFGGNGFRTFDPEQVDAYELGAKTKFGGPVPGTVNAAVFYNDLKDQQMQYGFLPNFGSPTTAILNTGSSEIQGFELETLLWLLDDLSLNISYTYLDTQLKKAPVVPSTDDYTIVLTAREGDDLTFSPMHSAMASLNYRLPLPAEIGEVSLGAVYSYTGSQTSTSEEYSEVDGTGRTVYRGSPYGRMPSYELVNLSANWMGIMNSDFDAGLFMTNALDEEYTTYVPGLYNSMGFETRMVGVPKMWGAKLRYNFGA